ncbi:5,10-methenyltetrahydrofolate synthetase [Nitrosomonas sp. Nm51]|uniref:5-formyltetrahydrofolate cyclo-ligase n=1 Tax=Nitrosomonas sp. Nm51 TaxID=133720 RepID=UPI0008C7326D|nr:5-formyltetrahydrofolate cyclo-ligase [Nitrosomonas sp. Nm51]SER56355.1 5,10-methenyltetrahydrofolate synthetase [Nitrosomonas sp. Nm51]
MMDWQVWRKRERERIIAARLAVPSAHCRQWSAAISVLLQQGFPRLQQKKIGLYWPFRGEYDPRPAALYFRAAGAILALPEVTGKNKPLRFREWWPAAPMRIGAYDIPVPHETRCIQPDVLIVPMVGFDRKGYRLGYGSGYFDRTLAMFSERPPTIGVAFELQRLENVHPQSHDIAMQYVITEAGIFQAGRKQLKRIPAGQCAKYNITG